MRILTLANTPLDESQGSGYVISNFARGLAQRGHHVDLVGAPQTEWPAGFHRAIRYRQMLGMARIAARSWNQGYDIMEFYGGEAWLAISQLRRRARRKTLLVAHSNGLESHAGELLSRSTATRAGLGSRFERFLRRLYESTFRSADALVTVSHFDRDFALLNRYQPETRLLTIENSLPDAFLGRPLETERAPCVLYCGAWTAIKGIELIRQDMELFLGDHPEWRFLVVGVGADWSPTRFSAAVRGRVEVIPRADRLRELPTIYRSCAIAIQASHYESFGLAAAEAMACGCALVATPVGFAASLRHGEQALLLPEAASPHLYEALKSLANDPERRRRIARGGHRRVQSLRWDTAVERLEAAYLGWLAQLRSGSTA